MELQQNNTSEIELKEVERQGLFSWIGYEKTKQPGETP